MPEHAADAADTTEVRSPVDYGRSLLVTDLYQLNMVEAYLANDMAEPAVFEFFVRRMPKTRGFLMAAGLEQAVRFLMTARVDDNEIAWLRETGRFSERLIAFLRDFRFSGDVDAIPEGTIVFADEPLIRVTAPVAQAQLVETRLINFLQFQTLVATKAARMRFAAPGKALVDFGLRRAHSGESGLLAARAAYLAGFSGTASVAAGRLFGIPLFGTMAHSFVQTFDTEAESFLAFARARPDQTTLLIDTYDTEDGARNAVAVASVLKAEGLDVRGVRLDSGDLVTLAKRVRAILDNAGLSDARIVASGGIDEFSLETHTAMDAPIDAYGVGTSLVTSQDQPALDCAYKLKAYAGVARRKRSTGKDYWPGATQVFRRFDGTGCIETDFLTTASDADGPSHGEPLLKPILRNGALVTPLPDLERLRKRADEALGTLPKHLRALRDAPLFEAVVSTRLRALADAVDRRTMPPTEGTA